MRKSFIQVCVMLCMLLAAGTAMADSIKGRIGVSGKIGVHVPSDSRTSLLGQDLETEAGLRGGGSLLYGIGDSFALELDVAYTWFNADFSKSKVEEFATTNISMGVQYRFVNLPVSKLVPYVGGGVDVLLTDTTDKFGGKGSVDTVPGAHANGGVDYFILKQLALTAELKVVVAPDADIKFNGVKLGDYDPTSFASTIGLRYFFN